MLRCLSDADIEISNFYGLLCCDCVFGYFLLPDHYLIANQDSTRTVDGYLTSDTEEDSSSQVFVGVNAAYQPIKKIGRSICNEDTIPSSDPSFSATPLNEKAEIEPSDIDNEILNDPDLAYYRQFDTIEHRLSETVSTCHLSILDSDRQTLLSGDEDDRKIRRCLTRYQYSISATNDVKIKKQLVEEYETFKSKYDADNTEDAEKAELYLANARNSENSNHPDKKRIQFYQKAIAFTNDPDQKKVRRNEYRDFCYSIQKNKGGSTKQQSREQSV